MGTVVRFVVTNLAGRAKHLYEKVYCARGNAKNLIKDFKRHTRADKTACHRSQANQMRCSCTWVPTGCSTRCGGQHRSSRTGTTPRSPRCGKNNLWKPQRP